MTINDLKAQILEKLLKCDWVSGEEIAEEFGFTRTYIWKAVNMLRNDGYVIKAVPNLGYKLDESRDVIDPDTLRLHLAPGLEGIKLCVYDTVDSTNTAARRLAEAGTPEWTTIIARGQTDGRGRNGHKFFSPHNTGIYMSVVLKPAIPARDAVLLTTAAAVAVAKALEKNCGVKTGIKWVNDVYIDGKKVCGILTEASFEPDSACLSYAVIGIGINLLPPDEGFPEDIKDTAAAVIDSEALNLKSRVIADVLNGLLEYYHCLSFKGFYNDYKKRCFFLKKPVTYVKDGKTVGATAVNITESFELTVRNDDGTKSTLNSGEISIKT